MRMFCAIGLVSSAVLAFGAVVAGSAFAGEWLLNGNQPAVGTPANSEGELQLTDLTSLGEETFDCREVFMGEVESPTMLLVMSILNLKGELIGEALSGLALECSGLGLCTGTVLAWWEHLPWLVELELMAFAPEYLAHLTEDSEVPKGMPTIHIICKNVLGGETEDLCEGLFTGILENMSAAEGGLLETFNLAEQEANGEQAFCTLSNAHTGHIAGNGLLYSSVVGDMSVS